MWRTRSFIIQPQHQNSEYVQPEKENLKKVELSAMFEVKLITHCSWLVCFLCATHRKSLLWAQTRQCLKEGKLSNEEDLIESYQIIHPLAHLT